MNRTKRQWIDLGVHTEACITHPETCGAAGGSVAFWMRVIDYDSGCWGIISSTGSRTTGFRIYTTYKLRYIFT